MKNKKKNKKFNEKGRGFYAPKGKRIMKNYNNKTNYYRQRQIELREEAIDWQESFANGFTYYWSEMIEFYDYFYTMGKRYGLLKEFKNEGII